MSASLVGSEMCIRDRDSGAPHAQRALGARAVGGQTARASGNSAAPNVSFRAPERERERERERW
eukprot:8394572-Alexandrium_andersonii.AAC.1